MSQHTSSKNLNNANAPIKTSRLPKVIDRQVMAFTLSMREVKPYKAILQTDLSALMSHLKTLETMSLIVRAIL